MKKIVLNGKNQPIRDQNGISIIAQPIVRDKLLKKTLKLVKKASKEKKIRRGVKEVQKALRKKNINQKAIVILAGDISPIDVISHLPVLCETHNVPYLFVPSKIDLGSAGCTKRPTSCIMIIPDENWQYKELFNEFEKSIIEITPKF